MTLPGTVPAALLAAAALASLAGRAPADEVRMKDGRLLEGKVLEDGPGGLRIRLRFGGELTLPRADVEGFERKDLPEETVAKRRAALDPKDVEGRWALAREAKSLHCARAFEQLLDEVLALDPTHAGANEARGNVLFDGRWVKAEDRDRLAAEKERAEREAREEARVREALAAAAGVPLTSASSERFTVLTVFPQKETDRFLADAEQAYRDFTGLFPVEPGVRLFGLFESRPDGRLVDDPRTRAPRRCTVVLLEKDSQYQRFLDGFLQAHEELGKVARADLVGLWRKQQGFSLVDPDCWVVGYQFPYPLEQLRHTVVHKVSHVMLMRWSFRGTAWPNWWLVEGLGEVQEIAALGSCQVFCVTTGYGLPNPDSKTVGEGWKEIAKRMVAAGGDRALRDLVVLGLNDLAPADLVKSWSFVHFLATLDREKLQRLTVLLKGRRVRAPDAFLQVYEATLEQMDDRWRQFVKRTY